MDVFNCCGRCDLDHMNTVSRQFAAAIRTADSLRSVDIVKLGYDNESETYQAVFESTVNNQVGTRQTRVIWR